MVGKNIGDMLNSKNITWGWFSAGFKPSIRTAEGKWICTFTNHTSFGGWNSHDYYPDDEVSILQLNCKSSSSSSNIYFNDRSYRSSKSPVRSEYILECCYHWKLTHSQFH